MKEEIRIGLVTLYYRENGTLVNGFFTPEEISASTEELLDDLLKINPVHTEEAVKEQAKYLLSAWFARMNKVELADRSKYEIGTEILRCDRCGPDNNIRKCTVRLTLKRKE